MSAEKTEARSVGVSGKEMNIFRDLDSRDIQRFVKEYLVPGIRAILREEMEKANVDRRAVNRLEDRLGTAEANMGRLSGRVTCLEEMVQGRGGAEIVRMILDGQDARKD